MEADLLVRGRRIVTPAGVAPGEIVVRAGTIVSVGAPRGGIVARHTVDAGDAIVMPGLVDTHVHVNEPGRTEWEGFRTATRAAAAGGVTTLLDMPLNSIPATTTAAALAAKRAAAVGQCWVDVGFIGGVVPGNQRELRALHDGGVFAFKCFLVPSGVEEFGCVSEADLRLAMPELTALGATLMTHAELPGPLARASAARSTAPAESPRSYGAYLASRPRAAENEAIDLMIRLCEAFGTRVHIVHLSSADALPALRAARRLGLPVSVETCPHYLAFCAEEITDGATEFKCAPPIRERANGEALWAALLRGDIDLVVSDHSPCPPAMKHASDGDFAAAWGGVASLEVGLSAVWSEARRRGVAPERLADWMCAAPARMAGLDRKGVIAPGRDADFVIWDPDAERTVDPGALAQRHKVTPYAGRRLPGVVAATYLRGRPIYEHGVPSEEPEGTILTRLHR